MESCKAKITKFELPISKVQEILADGGGTIALPTTPYAVDLATMESQYHKYHTPWGQPGDKVYILERYRITKMCTLPDSKYILTIEYEDGTEKQVPNNVPVALTAKNAWISGANAPDYAIRLKMVIQDVQMTGDSWLFTLAPETSDETDNTSL